MARAIDADILKENCRITGEFMNNFECVSLKTLGEIIDKQPTIEAESMKHGKWIVLGQRAGMRYPTHYCSECGEHGWKEYQYCQHCGSRMDGDSE